MNPELKIEFADSSITKDELSGLVKLINLVYDESEKGMWRSEYKRINTESLKGLINNGEIITARLNDRIVGSICIYPKGNTNVEFRMLVADPELRGQRIGARLVEYIERWAPENGYSKISLVLITPTTFQLGSKQFLYDWYTRIGYQHKYTKKAKDVLPHLDEELATDCNFSVYEKKVG